MIEVHNVEFPGTKDRNDILCKDVVVVVRIFSDKESQSMGIKVIYIATSLTDAYDQVLCKEKIEEIPEGVVEFDLTFSPPDLSKIPKEHLLGLTSIVVVCSTPEGKEFTRIGYFVKVEYPGIYIKEEDIVADESSVNMIDQVEDEMNELDESEELNESSESNQSSQSNQANNLSDEIPEGCTILTPAEFANTEIDLSKIQAQLLEPPLVTLFSEAWAETPSNLQEEGAPFTSAAEMPEKAL